MLFNIIKIGPDSDVRTNLIAIFASEQFLPMATLLDEFFSRCNNSIHPGPAGNWPDSTKNNITMEKLEKLTAALKNGTSVVDIILQNASKREIATETECPCGTPQWEDYVEGIVADAHDIIPRAA